MDEKSLRLLLMCNFYYAQNAKLWAVFGVSLSVHCCFLIKRLKTKGFFPPFLHLKFLTFLSPLFSPSVSVQSATREHRWSAASWPQREGPLNRFSCGGNSHHYCRHCHQLGTWVLQEIWILLFRKIKTEYLKKKKKSACGMSWEIV